MSDTPVWMKPPSEQPKTPEIDTTVVSPARIYDYWLGGNDNYAVDREAAEQVISIFPGIIPGVRANRAFLGRAVRYLVAEAGVRQFLDIGTGLPTENNTHEVAQAVAPDCRVVYVDNDPIVLVHARALLTSSEQGATAYLEADLRDPETIIRGAAETLEFSEPIAVTLLMILMLVEEANDPYGLVSEFMAAVPSGSYLVISHPASDVDSGEIAQAYDRLNERMGGTQGTLRTRSEVSRFFEGLDMVEPGLVRLDRWPDADASDGGHEIAAYAGVGRKP